MIEDEKHKPKRFRAPVLVVPLITKEGREETDSAFWFDPAVFCDDVRKRASKKGWKENERQTCDSGVSERSQRKDLGRKRDVGLHKKTHGECDHPSYHIL